MVPPDHEERLTVLFAEVLQQREELDELRTRSVASHELLTLLATDVARLVQDRDDAPSTPCWVDLDQESAVEAWGALGEWVEHVLLVRYPYLATKARLVIPPCWYRHNPLVEELSALHIAWCYAFRDSSAPPNAAIEWHKRLDEMQRRTRRLTDCKAEHEDDETPIEITDPGFGGFVVSDVMSRPAKPPEE